MLHGGAMVSARATCEQSGRSSQLLDRVRGRGKILIIVHDNPDPDCLASAMALRHLFTMKLNGDATIAFSGMIGRSENLAMAKELEIPLTPLPLIDLAEFPVICMLDTQPGTGNNSLPDGVRVDVVIDHHPLRQLTTASRFVDVRDEYGVTATILYEYLLEQQISISTKMATAIFYAIKSETQDLGREAERPDREAYHRLFPLVNKTLLNAITHPPVSREYFTVVYRTLRNARLYGSLLVASLGGIDFPEIVAEMADFLMRHEGTELVLTMGFYNDELILSLRSSRPGLNAGELIGSLVAGQGKAGGHGMMAGGKITGVSRDVAAGRRLTDDLTARLVALLGLPPQPPESLIASVPPCLDQPPAMG
jgi:nanoRNase/pAp phosphatase (c-di-AMP/oligoRNAs hydrolase)